MISVLRGRGPPTTLLSPYVAFGCVSVRTFHAELTSVYAKGPARAAAHVFVGPVARPILLYFREPSSRRRVDGVEVKDERAVKAQVLSAWRKHGLHPFVKTSTGTPTPPQRSASRPGSKVERAIL